MPEFSLAGKTVLITQAAQGIGAEIARCFGCAGASLVLHYNANNQRDNALSLSESLRNRNIRNHIWHQDFSDPNHKTDVAEEVDILINNAAVACEKPFLEASRPDFDITMSANFRACYFLAQAFAKKKVADSKPGVILFISSIHASSVFLNTSVDAATKGAIASFVRHLSLELAPHNIRVNAIDPGYIDVPHNQKTITIARLGTCEDIGNLAVFLTSDLGSFINGQTLARDSCTITRFCSDENS